MNQSTDPILSLAHWLTVAASLFLSALHFTLKAAGAIANLGIFQIGAAAVLFTHAIKPISTFSANLVAVIEPVFNPVGVFLALGERPGLTAIAGGAIIIAAVTGASIINARRAQ